MKDIAKEAIRVVENGEIKIRPESSEKSYYRWMYSINDVSTACIPWYLADPISMYSGVYPVNYGEYQIRGFFCLLCL